VSILQPQSQTLGFVARHRFVLLFFSLVAFFVLAPILHEIREAVAPQGLPFIEPILFLGLLGGVVVSLTTTPHAKAAALGLGLPTAILTIGHGFYNSTALALVRHLFSALFLGYTMAVMLRFIFTTRRVDFNTIAASLCIYLLLGLIWALAYSSIDSLNPHAFKFMADTASPAPTMRIGTGTSMAALYFSFTTMTTLGYGDIVPLSPIARGLAIVEAITGQLYLVVLVSRLVGLQIADSINQDHP
jgi:voltage-gated potassium channel